MTENKKTVLITGSTGGIGSAIARKFADNGYNLVLHARKDSETLQHLVSNLASDYDLEVVPITFDLSNVSELESRINVLMKSCKIDVLVNNAGVLHEGLFMMTPMDEIKLIFSVNLFGPMNITQLILPSMIRKKSGVIINIASEGGLHPRKGDSAYGSSKAAVIAWTKSLAAEVGMFGIRANAVAPGATETKMIELMDENTRAEHLKKCPLRRLAKPDEVADAVYYLSSDQASFINGHILSVDGGIT